MLASISLTVEAVSRIIHGVPEAVGDTSTRQITRTCDDMFLIWLIVLITGHCTELYAPSLDYPIQGLLDR